MATDKVRIVGPKGQVKEVTEVAAMNLCKHGWYREGENKPAKAATPASPRNNRTQNLRIGETTALTQEEMDKLGNEGSNVNNQTE
jgi:hypothetical protein